MRIESTPGSDAAFITATFQGGPANGETRRLPETLLQVQVEGIRYVLHFTDKRGVAHYYVPTT